MITYKIALILTCSIRVRQNFDKALSIVDPDPGKCYMAKRMKCDNCSKNEKESSTAVYQAPQLETRPIQGNWNTDTSCLPKQFSYISIVNHAKKSGRNSGSYVEKTLEKGYKFFYENYLHACQPYLQEMRFLPCWGKWILQSYHGITVSY